MTSKEKLLLLYKNAKENFKQRVGFLKRKDLVFPELEEECYQDLVKDLEVLEILTNESDNKRIIERNGIVSFHLDMILTTDNYSKIKEWLENEN